MCPAILSPTIPNTFGKTTGPMRSHPDDILRQINPLKNGLGLVGILLSLVTLATRAEIVVSEIMYHPTPVTETDVSDSGEYLELYNTGSDTVNLSGHHFDRGITFAFPEGTLVQPHSYIVLAKTVSAHVSTVPSERLFGGYTGMLSNSGETIRLVGPADQIIASVTYGTTGDWPAAADGTGHSLIFDLSLIHI